MTGTADPWGPPITGALQGREAWTPRIERSGGPERTYDKDAADPDWTPRPVGFLADLEPPSDADLADAINHMQGMNFNEVAYPLLQREPLLWEGDNS